MQIEYHESVSWQIRNRCNKKAKSLPFFYQFSIVSDLCVKDWDLGHWTHQRSFHIYFIFFQLKLHLRFVKIKHDYGKKKSYNEINIDSEFSQSSNGKQQQSADGLFLNILIFLTWNWSLIII